MNRPDNILAYDESDSIYRLCPSAYMVSKASDDLPDPESPVNTRNLFLGNFRFIFFRLCSRAPWIVMYFSSDILYYPFISHNLSALLSVRTVHP